MGKHDKRSPEQKFKEQINKNAPKGCWLWTGQLWVKVAYFRAGGKQVSVHRWSYEHFIGPIPPLYKVSQSCEIRHCVNPEHLILVPPDSPYAPKACSNGHIFTVNNSLEVKVKLLSGGTGHQRICLTCRRSKQKLEAERRKERQCDAAYPGEKKWQDPQSNDSKAE